MGIIPRRIAQMPPDAEQSRLATLLSRSALGDRAAFAQLYAATRAKLFAVSLRIVRERQIAEEVLQDSFVSIWSHAGDYGSTLKKACALYGVSLSELSKAVRDARSA